MKKSTLSFTLPLLLVVACGNKESSSSSPATNDPSKIQISVTEKGFEPDRVDVPANKPVTLVFTRKTDKTCAKEVVLTMDEGKKIEKSLPIDEPVEIAATFPKSGKLGYACSMDMIKGTIVVQ